MRPTQRWVAEVARRFWKLQSKERYFPGNGRGKRSSRRCRISICAKGLGRRCRLHGQFRCGNPRTWRRWEASTNEQIRVGDRVASRTLTEASDQAQSVTQLVRHSSNDLVTITFTNSESVTATPEHLLRGYQRGWVEAKDLGTGNLVEGNGGQPVAIAKVALNHSETPVEVYNYTVSKDHDYRVATGGVLVHNPAKARTCHARYDPKNKTVTEEWSNSELERRFPVKKDFRQFSAISAPRLAMRTGYQKR